MSKSDPQARLVEAAFKLLARKSWPEVTLAETARVAGLPFSRLNALAASKPALVGAMLHCVGNETAARYRPDKQSRIPRDRLFDVAMTWFEVLAPRKAGLRSLYGGLRRDPLALAAARGDFVRAAQWLLALAEADAGSAAPIKAVAIMGILVRAIPIWLADGKDMAKTMARLDGDLRRAERLLWSKTPDAGAARPAGGRKRATRP